MAAIEWTKRLPSPSTLNTDVFPETVVDMIMEEQRKIVDQYTRDMLCSVPKYTIMPDRCKCEWNLGDIDFVKKIGKDDCLSTVEAWNIFNKTNNEKEKEKMNAKRCDRCGKLYIPTDDAPIRAYLCGRVTEHEKETYLPEKNKEFNTFNIKITLNSIDTVDMCPECREKLKEFFESGADEATGKLRKA